ncbi:uncharacterized protein M6B38_141565 [Iris pallida]|uniref:Virilizer N-terminal domain-containing protein n=1 Tax=Iris pallida TaxID=29817 RepID=A0AAX6FD00_IRIPA|nr:uncharacterized protein M6B38_141565 [Iris pallida]
MGRPEPCILFAQTFSHSQLDEYVDEVLFAEPIVVTACEFLEQNASLSTPMLTVQGATTPPSFAMEVFVHCEGESRFRRLCQPFLYSHSSSNVLEVEAVITNHLVVRGCYRSLTLVVHGNTAEDFGQFNIEFDLDNSVASLVSSPSEGKLEDLPPALLLDRSTFEESISSTKSLALPVPVSYLSSEMKQFIKLTLNIYQISNDEDTIRKVARSVVAVVCSHVATDCQCGAFTGDGSKLSNKAESKKDTLRVHSVLSEERIELFELFKRLQTSPGNDHSLEEEVNLEADADTATSQLLVDTLHQCFPFLINFTPSELSVPFQKKNLILSLNVVLLLCSARDGCFHFVNSGGMEQIAALVAELFHRSTSLALLILGVIENATRHAIGCEGFLGWWPRENESVPVGKSDGYSNLLKMLLTKQRHDVASLATYVLQRLHFYESISRYESAILSVLEKLPADNQHLTDEVDSLSIAASQLKQIMKLLNLCGRIEDPSPVAAARRSIIPGRSEGLLSYTGTSSYISLSKYSFSKWDIDTCMLLLLKEKGFLPLSAALLSSSLLHSSSGSSADIAVDIATSIQSLLLSLLFCRSGLTLLLLQPEATATIILSLQGVEERSREECSTLRQAAVLMSKNFFCHPHEVAVILETHLRVGNAIDRLLMTPTNSDELLWVLWDLCSISRSDCGRQALLSLGFFPEAVSVLLGALHSLKDLEQIAINNGTSPLCLATFHSAAEIFEVIVTDSTASSLSSWIGHAVELHKALHSSSPGSNRKDAPTRLLEWVDAGVVYHKNGAIGLLKYAAILASGGDAHLSSASVLVSDSMDVENVVGDSSNSSDAQILDILLGKFVSDKYFDGVMLRSSSIVQLTSAIRILSFISENSAVAAALFEEGAVTLIYVVLSNCKCMLEQSSNTYDYLVDEGAECNSTSDLLLERSHEQNLVDLIIPSLVLLINLLQRLHEAKELYRNKKLVNILLRLHREVSPKLAARATDYSSSYPSLLLGFGAVCHLIASTLACWPIFNWIPSLFHCLLESQATSSLALGPKDACSMLHLLGDFFPEEGIWLWCNGMPPLSAFRTLSIGSILGPESERDVDWFLQPEHLTVLLVRLTPQLDRIAQIVLHFAFSTLVIIQDMLRVFIIRIACQRTECAVVLLRPLISWIDNHVNEASHSEIDNFKVHRLLDFIASLLEHPRAKTILLKVEAVEVLHKILRRFADAYNPDGKLNHENIVPGGSNTSRLSWSIPLFKSLALIFEPQAVEYSKLYDKYTTESISIEVSTLIGRQLLRLCQVLPVGGELLACFLTLKEFALSNEGRNALLEIFSEFKVSVCKEQGVDERDSDADVSVKYNWRCSPFFHCWKKLLTSLDAKDDTSIYNFEIIYALSLSALCLCMGSENLEGLSMLKWLFGLPYDLEGDCLSPDERMNDVLELVERLDQRPTEDDIVPSNKKITLHQVKESVRLMLELLQSSVSSSTLEEALVSSEGSSSIEVIRKLTTSQLIPSLTMSPNDDEGVFSHIWKPNENGESDNSIFSYGGLAEKFVWECPDTSSDRLMQAPQGKRKMTSMEIPGKRVRENSGSEAVNVFSRTPSMPVVSSGPSRRDTFRQRKPNTSRPPSMHVDDYVARERNIDGASSGSHVLTSQRGGSTSGRPPSVHVDEFEARQRERQNPTFVTVGSTAQAKPLAHDDLNVPEKLDKSHQLKADIDDELQELDIVFDEESGSDDRLPFPQPDDILQSDPVIVRGRSSGSVVEETEGDANDGAQASEDVNSRPETGLNFFGSQTEIPKEGTFSFDKSLPETSAGKAFFRRQSDEPNYASPTSTSKGSDALPPGFPSHMIHPNAPQSLQALAPPNFHQRGSPQQGPNNSGSQGYYEHKFPISQPPLPPMPPPNVSAMSPQTTEVMPGLSSPYIHREMQPPFLSGYALQAFNSSGTAGPQSENLSSMNNGSLMSRTNAQPAVDNKYLRNTDSPGSRLHGEKYSSSTASQPLPPLPPMPPPFSTPMAQSASSSGSQSLLHTQNLSAGSHLPSHSAPISDAPLNLFSGNSLSSFSLSPFTQPLLMSRPPAVTGNFFGSPTQHLGQIPSSGPQSIPSPQQPMQSVQPQLPPPPPQQPHPPHLAQNLGISVHVPQPQYEQMIPIQQGSIQVQMQPLQMRQQQIHIPQIQLLYQPQQQEQFQHPPQPLLEHAQPKLEGDNTAQQQNDLGALQHYFSSPEAIQSLLSDRDKLCQLLEQNPKIMEMLQAKLGQM